VITNEWFQIVDFAVWLLFNKCTRVGGSTKHILCQGFTKVPSCRMDNENLKFSAISGLIPLYPNKHYDEVKADPWPQVLGLLGKGGDRVMIDLLVDCGIFLAVANGHGNYYQISGMYTNAEYLEQVAELKRRAARRPPSLGPK
jgi:telomerase reverse transcriptase